MTKEEVVNALAEMDEVPFSRSTLEKLEDEELAQVCNEVGASDLRLALSAKVGGLRRRLERTGLVTNKPKHVKLGFAVQSTLGCGPGDTSRFTEDRFRAGNEEREGGSGGSGKGISFTPRSTLGEGPGDKSRFDR